MNKVKYFEPGTTVWVHMSNGTRVRAIVDARQAGVYRVRFESDQSVELRKAVDVSLRVKT